MPQISVIVPVYKVEQYLDRCVESILAQTFADFELILVDDGSPDNCPKMCDDWATKDARIKVIHKPNGGLSDARNAGIDWVFANSKSDWLHFVDSDDYIHPRMLEVLYNAAIDNATDVSICDYYTSNNPTPDIDEITFEKMSVEAAYEKRCGLLDLAVGKLYKKELFTDIRYPFGLLYEDSWTTYKVIFSVKELAFASAQLYCYYVNPESITKSKWSPKWLAEIEAHEEQLRFFYKKNLTSALQTGIKAYVWIIQKQIDAMKKCGFDTSKYRKASMAKLRKTLKTAKQHIPDKVFYNSVWEYSHPRLSSFKAILSRILLIKR
ncbi:MAG: glycosyltransferase [Clostridia bacterium]|nr:glycosyltransferase [Clostridia bacterium]